MCAEEEKKRIKAESAPPTPREGDAEAEAKKEAAKKKKKKKERIVAQGLERAVVFFFCSSDRRRRFAGSQDPKTLDPDMEELEAAQEEMLGERSECLVKRVLTTWQNRAQDQQAESEALHRKGKTRLQQFDERANARRDGVHVVSGPFSFFCCSCTSLRRRVARKAYHLAGLTPVDEPGKARCLRELFKFAGSKPEFLWLAKRGEEWVGQYNKDLNSPLDKKISAWIKTLMTQLGFKADDQGRIDYQTYVRIFCNRRVDHHLGN